MPSTVPDTLAAALDRRLGEAQMASRLPSISAAAVRGREIVWQRALGLADASSETPAAPDTQYRIGSITKTFTAVAVMRLHDQNRLDLDDELSRHLPEVPRPALTIGRLMSHLSGLQREPLGVGWEDFDFPSTERVLREMAEAERVLPAGTSWHYSNLAYALLGEVVARLAGRAWHEEIQACLLDPLGLSDTTLTPRAPAAQGYFVDPHADRLHPMPPLDIAGISAAGQLWSTTGDLARWAAFLGDPDPALLSPRSAEQMRSVQVMAEPDRWSLAWGRGLMLHRRGDEIFAGHNGGMPGFQASIVYSRTGKAGAAVLTNTGSGLPDPADLAIDLTRELIRLWPPDVQVWRPGLPAPPEIESILGGWWSEGYRFVFSFESGALHARRDGTPAGVPPAVFEENGPDRFRTVSGRERGELLRVVRDGAGEVAKLYWATYPFERHPIG
ncbi:MAG: serine hydrolase domain-containing protein [Candidatus Dormibacteraceae bacterium]